MFKQNYVVKGFRGMQDQTPKEEFQHLINQMFNEGYKLHSVIPQNDGDGETYSNVVIFEKIN